MQLKFEMSYQKTSARKCWQSSVTVMGGGGGGGVKLPKVVKKEVELANKTGGSQIPQVEILRSQLATQFARGNVYRANI